MSKYIYKYSYYSLWRFFSSAGIDQQLSGSLHTEKKRNRQRGQNRITDGNKGGERFSFILNLRIILLYPRYTIRYRELESMQVHAIGCTRQTDSCELPYTETLYRMLLFDSKRHNLLIY